MDITNTLKFEYIRVAHVNGSSYSKQRILRSLSHQQRILKLTLASESQTLFVLLPCAFLFFIKTRVFLLATGSIASSKQRLSLKLMVHFFHGMWFEGHHVRGSSPKRGTKVVSSGSMPGSWSSTLVIGKKSLVRSQLTCITCDYGKGVTIWFITDSTLTRGS